MYAFIRGILHSCHGQEMIVETSGVGYVILVPSSVMDQAPEIGKEILLYTSFVVRENEQALFGFSTMQQKNLFQTITQVNGIGPKLGLSVLGALPTKELVNAVSVGDIRTLCRIPGIGKRTAERLVVELKDRLPDLFPRDTLEPEKAAGAVHHLFQDALSALQNLGYTQAMASKALTDCQEEASDTIVLSEFIALALKRL